MGKAKYTPDHDLIAYRAIALGGTDSAAYQTMGIDQRTFYRWMSRHDSFREAVDRGREFNRKSSPDALRLALMGYIVKVLEDGGETITTNQRVMTRETRRNRENQVTGMTEIEVNTQTTEYRGLPKWIADKIMANASGLNEAIAKTINAGYEVVEAGSEDTKVLPYISYEDN